MTVPTSAQRSEAISGPPMEIPVERFSQDDAGRESVAAKIRSVVDECRAKAREYGVEAEVFGDDAPSGVDQDRHALNQRVEAHMARHGGSIQDALRAVSGESPARKGVDADREQMNARVEAVMAERGCDIREAMRVVEREAA